MLSDLQTIQFYIFESGGGVKWRGLVEITIPIHEGYTPRTCWRTPDLKLVGRKGKGDGEREVRRKKNGGGG